MSLAGIEMTAKAAEKLVPIDQLWVISSNLQLNKRNIKLAIYQC
jgi:hypothetical protein